MASGRLAVRTVGVWRGVGWWLLVAQLGCRLPASDEVQGPAFKGSPDGVYLKAGLVRHASCRLRSTTPIAQRSVVCPPLAVRRRTSEHAPGRTPYAGGLRAAVRPAAGQPDGPAEGARAGRPRRTYAVSAVRGTMHRRGWARRAAYGGL